MTITAMKAHIRFIIHHRTVMNTNPALQAPICRKNERDVCWSRCVMEWVALEWFWWSVNASRFG